jgi:HK97 gp10 family phage protein
MANGRNPGASRAARTRKVRLFDSAGIKVTLEGDIAAQIRAFAAEVQEKVVRPMTYAGAKIMYDAMRYNVPLDSGVLRDSIYHWFDDKRSKNSLKIYMIGPNKAKAPHWYNVEYGHWRYNKIVDGRFMRSKSDKNRRVPVKDGVITGDFRQAHDLNGALQAPVWVPANPYIRVTFDQNIQRAVEAMKQRARERIREVITEIST